VIKNKDLGTNIEQTFAYNPSGNLSVSGVSYDDKLNPYHTSKTWMLIYKDFSVNNPLTPSSKILSYNSFALPTKYQSTDANTATYLFGYRYTTAAVKYNCEISQSPNDLPGK
jgi:hypothetical protein